jgi:hypothetical protein
MAAAYNRYQCVTVSILKHLRNGRFNSETTTLIQQCFKTMGVFIEKCVKYLGRRFQN